MDDNSISDPASKNKTKKKVCAHLFFVIIFKSGLALKATRLRRAAITARLARARGATALKTRRARRALNDLDQLQHHAQRFIHRGIAAEHTRHIIIEPHRKALVIAIEISPRGAGGAAPRGRLIARAFVSRGAARARARRGRKRTRWPFIGRSACGPASALIRIGFSTGCACTRPARWGTFFHNCAPKKKEDSKHTPRKASRLVSSGDHPVRIITAGGAA